MIGKLPIKRDWPTTIYSRAIIPAFETIVKRRGIFAYWRELESSQWWSREQIEDLQLQRLRALLTYSGEHSSYYRELWSQHGLRVADLKSLADFTRWPLTTRSTLRDQADRIRVVPPRQKVVRKSTGGSSGSPLSFTIDTDANDRRIAAAFRGYAFAGAGPGTKQTHLWGVPLCRQSCGQRLKEFCHSHWLYRRQLLSSFDLSPESIPRFVERMNRFRPHALVAYTNPLDTFAKAIEERGIAIHQPHCIVVGAEKLFDFQRQRIERVFSAPVFETYGSREFTLIGAECERHSGLHLTAENLIVEVVDDSGRPTPAGREGNVAVTDLFNLATPFVRYLIGDRAIAGFESCRCGRGLPLLQKVVGRRLDMLRTADGKHLAGEFFPHLLKDYPEVRQFQVVQRQDDLIELKLVVSCNWNATMYQGLQRSVVQAVGSGTHVRLLEVDHIPLTAQGKLRVVVNELSCVGGRAS